MYKYYQNRLLYEYVLIPIIALRVTMSIYYDDDQQYNIPIYYQIKRKGPFRESNPGPPAPEAGIIPLDQTDCSFAKINLNNQVT